MASNHEFEQRQCFENKLKKWITVPGILPSRKTHSVTT